MPNPEELARQTIDAQLRAAGWVVQSLDELNLSAARGVAVREMQSMGGPADYILFVDGRALGVVEAKKAGTTLSGVAEQSARYTYARKWIPQLWADPLPFTYESTGIETNFRDQRDPDSRSRPVFAFHTPEHLVELVQQPATLRKRLRHLAISFPLITKDLRDCQIDANTGLERSLADNRPRALLQMATGSGKTYTAVTQAYRLIKHAGAITTSDFHKNAIEYAKSVQHKVILIGGQRLAELMIEYGVGVSTVRTIALKQVASDYFEEG